MSRHKRSDNIGGTVPAVNNPDSSTIVADSGDGVKRRRGRPRKHPIPEDTVRRSLAEIPSAASADIDRGGVAGNVQRGDPAVIAFKRPRGRPRKAPAASVPSSPSSPPAAGPAASDNVPPENAPSTGLVRSVDAAGAGPLVSDGARAMVDNPTVAVDPTRSMLPDAVGKPDPAVPAIPERARAGRPARARQSSPLVVEPLGNSPFCPECGTYVRLFKPRRGRTRRVCPRCHPERMIEKKDPRFSLDKTGMPCKDRGKCRPERCVKALECGEMARKGSIRGAGNGTGG